MKAKYQRRYDGMNDDDNNVVHTRTNSVPAMGCFMPSGHSRPPVHRGNNRLSCYYYKSMTYQ
jgi:hypothetical protein